MILAIKKYIIFGIAGIVLIFCLGNAQIQYQALYNKGQADFILDNIKVVSSGEELSMPAWSPDGNKLLVATAHGMKLKMIDLSASNSIKAISNARGAGYNATWSTDGNQVFFRYREDSQQNYESRAFGLGDGNIKSSKLNPNRLRSAGKAINNNDPEVFINLENLNIEAQTKDKTKSWTISDFDGQFYHPLLSPGKKTVIVHEKSEMYLFATDGSGLIKHLGTGIAGSWSPDGKYVLAFLDSSVDGHVITGSELYLIDIESGELTQFTHTEGINEMWPAWSDDGSKIAFEDERSGNIFVADIIKQ